MRQKCRQCKILFKKKYAKQKFCSIICSNRHNLNNKVVFKRPINYSGELAELFGILLGDGSVTKYYLKIYLNIKADIGYASKIEKIINLALPKAKVTIYAREKRGTEEIQVSSKDVCDYCRLAGFDPKKRYIPKWIAEKDKFIKRTIRGLFDTEGSIGIKRFQGKNDIYIYRQLTFTNSNKNLLKFVESGLLKFGFSPTKNSKKNIYLSNKKDIKRYFEIIGTNNPKLVKKLKMG